MTRPNARPVISNLPRLRVAKRRPGGFRIGCAGAILAKQLLNDDEEHGHEEDREDGRREHATDHRPADRVLSSRARARRQIGRAHVWTQGTNAQLVCRLLLETQNTRYSLTQHKTHTLN